MSFKKIVTDTFIQFLFLKISPMTDILVLDFSLAFIKYLFPATIRGFAIIIVNAIDIIAIIESTIPEVISFKLKYFIASEILNTYFCDFVILSKFASIAFHIFSSISLKISFYSSAHYMYQDVIYKYSPQNYNHYQFSTNLDAKITKAIKFGFDILGRQTVDNRGVRTTEDLFSYFLTTSPMSAPYYPKGLLRTG